jgi:acetolactate decarboxylase
MKTYYPAFLFLVFAINLPGAAYSVETNVLFQYSTMGALQEGLFDGTVTLGEMKRHGDFGIGTFDHLDGEMVEWEGTVYRIRSDGKVLVPEDSNTSPFAMSVFFRADRDTAVEKSMDLKELQGYLDTLLPSKNLICAVCLEGSFSDVRTRSVPRQEKPYPRLADAVKNQAVFEKKNVRGVLVGFRFPDYLKGVNMPGWHLHFLSDDHSFGGHLLDCRLENGDIHSADLSKFTMELPTNGEFLQTDVSGDKQKELEKIEK